MSTLHLLRGGGRGVEPNAEEGDIPEPRSGRPAPAERRQARNDAADNEHGKGGGAGPELWKTEDSVVDTGGKRSQKLGVLGRMHQHTQRVGNRRPTKRMARNAGEEETLTK